MNNNNYKNLIEEELDNIAKLSETPNLMREVALSGLESALQQNPPYLVKQKLENTKKSLENISIESIKDTYKIIYTQMGILAVSSLEATLKRYFGDEVVKIASLDKENKKLSEIKITAKDLVDNNLDYSEKFKALILEKETNSFQNLKLIKEVFEDYFGKLVKLTVEDEKKIIFYLEARHVLVHKSGEVDERFLGATSKMNANIKDYKLNDRIELDESDWDNIKKLFPKLVEVIST